VTFSKTAETGWEIVGKLWSAVRCITCRHALQQEDMSTHWTSTNCMNHIPSLEAAASHTWSRNLPLYIDHSTAGQCTAPSVTWIQSISTALFSCTLCLPLFHSPRPPRIHLLLPPHGKLLFLWYDVIYDIYLLTSIGLPPGGSSTVHIYTQTIHRTTQLTQYIE